MSILNILNELGSTTSKIEKESILLREKDNKVLKDVMFLSYDPRTNFYIKKIPEYSAKEFEPVSSLSIALGKLEALSTRKVTGGASSTYLSEVLSSLRNDDAIVVERVVKRDLRCGVKEATINKVWPKLIPEYPYMRYSLLSKVKHQKYTWKDGVYVQTKMDGSFTSIDVCDDGYVLGVTRQGEARPAAYFSEVYDFFRKNSDSNYQYHGEALVEEDGVILPREIGNGILNSLSKGGTLPLNCRVVYYVWDVVHLDVISGLDKCTEKYSERFARLSSLPFNDIVMLTDTTIVHSLEEAYSIYAIALANKKEGVMVKSGDLLWIDGTTNMGAKLKLEVDVDLVIVGFNPGEGKRASTFGSICCETSDGLLVVDVSGFSDDQLLEFHKNRVAMIGKIMTVRANDVTKTTPASLYLPRCVEIRDDKTVADTLQQVLDQFENAKMGKK